MKPTMDKILPQPWLRRPRSKDISGICVHGTHGPTDLHSQYAATRSWFQSQANISNPKDASALWFGSSADFIVGTEPGEICQVGEFPENRANWAAGLGEDPGLTWGVDESYVSVECAHTGDPQESWHPGVITNFVILGTWLTDAYKIPLIRIPYVAQHQSSWPPHGFFGHKDSGNGRRLGKSDPINFPYREAFTRIGNNDEAAESSLRQDLHDIIGRLADIDVRLRAVEASR